MSADTSDGPPGFEYNLPPTGMSLRDIKRSAFIETLKLAHRRVTGAATLLGISDAAMRDNMRKLDIPVSRAHDLPETDMRLPPEGMYWSEIERLILTQALSRKRSIQAHAARLLRVSKGTIAYKIRIHGIEIPVRQP